MEQGGDVTIVKPLNDKREYKRVVLPNALQVLLISDPDTDKTAASMDVSIGSFSDPEGLEGLAHFLEHMLFYASEKYPLENSYMQYLTEHGGCSNAFTDSEHTNFHFDVNADYFEGALDRFAQFFICPLMSPDATLREINAVDSENKKNILVDAWRLDQLEKHTSSDDHPFHKFSTGWASSLSAGETDSSFEYAFFGVTIELTDAGQEHMEEIVEFTFQYLNILRKSGVAEWIFDEIRSICNTMFHSRDKIQPINYVMNIASISKLYPPQDWIVASSLPSNFNPFTIRMVLDQLVPNNSRIFWVSKEFEGQTNEIEPWYGTAFSVEKIRDDLVKQWETSQPDARLGLPLPNVFIPTDLVLKQVYEKDNIPVLLRKSKFSRLWYKPDMMFFTPKAVIKLDFNCPASNCSPEAVLLTHIFTELLLDYLNEYAYYAEVAGLYYSIYGTGNGFKLEQDDSKINVQLELFVLSAKQAAFNQLRSIEQLGYIVQLGTRNDSGIRGAEFIIQSTVKDPAQLDLRVEAFLKMFESKLHAMSDDEFKTNVDALIDNKLEKHKNLQEQSSFYWSEIELGTLKFDRKEIEVAELRKLTKQDLIYFFDNYIKHGCPGRRKLTVQVYGSSHSGAYKQTKSIDISSDKNVCNGKTVTADTSDRELLKDDAVKLASSDQSSDMNSCELDGYRAKRIDDIHSFKRSQTLFGSLSGVNQVYT